MKDFNKKFRLDILPLPVKRESLSKALRGSLLKYSVREYSVIVYLSAVVGAFAGYIMFKVVAFKFYNLPHLGILSILQLLPLFFAVIFYLFSLSYPYISARSRKTKIDLKLPHAITYMGSLCGIMPLYDVFKQIFAEKDLYGEISEEFGFIVRDVELFGMSLSDAILNLAATTPSENLKEFIQGLYIVFESGGDLKGYMSAKAENFRDRARKQLEINMKTLEILAEVFSVLFVALPVFLIIIISTAHFLGGTSSGIFYMYLYVFMPVGGIALVYVIDLINIKEDLNITKIKRKKLNYPTEILENSKSGKNTITKSSESDDKLSKRKLDHTSIREIVLKPFKASKEKYYYSLVFTPVCLLLWYILLDKINFRFFESKIALLILLCMTPLSIAFEYRARFVRKVEKEIPDLLRQILSLKDVGLTLYGVVRMLKESKIGVLNREIVIVDSDIEWGSTVRDALTEFINRVGVASIRRAITLILRASEVTDNLRDVLITAIEDFEYELKMKDMRFAAGFAYLVVIYLSFFILLYVSYSIVSSFLSRLPNYTPSLGLLSMMYQIALMLSIFSGIIAGQMEKGHILYGLKHTFVFIVASIIVFEVIIPGLNLSKIIKI